MSTLVQNRRNEMGDYSHNQGVYFNPKNETTAINNPQLALVEFLPETKKVIEIADAIISGIQQDKKLDQFTHFFSELFGKNESVFTQKSKPEIGKIAFDFYRQKMMTYMESNREFQIAQNGVVQKMQILSSAVLEVEIQATLKQIVLERMRGMHSTFIEIALGRTKVINQSIDIHSPSVGFSFENTLKDPKVNLFS